VSRGSDAASLASDVMAVYRSLTDEQRDMIGTDEYRELFAEVNEEHTYDVLIHMLPQYSESEEVTDVYIGMYDRDTGALVYIADPDKEDPRDIGDWEYIADKELNKFLSWDGRGMLYDIDHSDTYGWMCTAGTPIYNENRELVCFILADLTVSNIWTGMRTYTFQITVVLLVALLVLLLLMINYIRRTLVDPINSIAGSAESYIKDKKNGVQDTEHFSKLNIHTGDEIENLSLIMADMEKDMAEYISNIQNITAEKERISTELTVATRIQAAMLPHIFPAFPDRSEFDIYATMEPAKEVGGDFYDYFLIDDDHLGIVIADVSGKGVPAALFMMAVKIIIANYAKMGQSPAQVLNTANKAICENNQEEMFVSVWLGILEISTGKLTAANAGHEYPAVRNGDGPFEMKKERHSLVVGAMEETVYREYEMTLTPGSKIFLYTDGVPEASNAENKLFGEERMVSALNKDPGAAPVQVLANVNAAVQEFVQGAEQFDDLTMLCLEYKGN
jgi:sigma-B regulation protein RsbU (phosphoserine phosphatase)